MNESSKRLNHLISLMKSGNQLYQQAQQRIQDKDLRTIFAANLQDRQRILEKLKSLPGGAGSETEESEDEARFRVDRADLLAVLKNNQAAVYARQLADLEAETERAFTALSDEGLGEEGNRMLRGLHFVFNRVRDRSSAARNIAWNRESPTTLPIRMRR